MRTILILLLFVPLIGFSQITVIPDAKFEQALIDLGYDKKLNGKIKTKKMVTKRLSPLCMK